MNKIAVVGSLNYDMVLMTDRIPVVGETKTIRDLHKVAGGKGMNQAVAIERLGAHALMIGCLGRDEYGTALFEALHKEKINCSGIDWTEQTGTGLAIVTVDQGGDNAIMVYQGSNAALTWRHVHEQLEDASDLKAIAIQMEIPFEVVYAVIRWGHQYGIPVILNPSPYRDLNQDLLALVDTLILNEVEVGQLLKETLDPKEAVIKLLAYGVRQVIITLGAHGVYFNEGDQVVFEPALQVKAVDTTAAGDTFLGAYSVKFTQGASVTEAVQFAVKASAIAVTRIGAQTSIPYLNEIL